MDPPEAWERPPAASYLADRLGDVGAEHLSLDLEHLPLSVPVLSGLPWNPAPVQPLTVEVGPRQVLNRITALATLGLTLRLTGPAMVSVCALDLQPVLTVQLAWGPDRLRPDASL